MKILQVVHGFPPQQKTGIEMLTYNLSRRLAERHQVHIFYPRYCRDNAAGDNLGIHTVAIGCSNIKRFFNIINLSNRNRAVEKRFVEVLDEVSPDIVHFQHLMGLSLALPVIAKRSAPVIISLSDYWLLCPTTHFLNWENSICNEPSPDRCLKCLSKGAFDAALKKIHAESLMPSAPVKFLRNLYAAVSSFFGARAVNHRQLLLREALERCDKLICLSQSVTKRFRDNGFLTDQDLTSNKAVVLSAGIDLAELEKVKKKEDRSKIVFGFVGGLSERKGVHVLVEAFGKIGDRNSQLRIYGKFSAKNSYCRRLKRIAGDNKAIKFIGEFSSLGEPYSQIDVLVAPSITVEGYGLVTQEAHAVKIPVIASNIGALNELIQDNVNGLLFAVGGSDDLAEKIKMIIDDTGLLDKFARGIPAVKSIRQYAEELEQIYQRLLKAA